MRSELLKMAALAAVAIALFAACGTDAASEPPRREAQAQAPEPPTPGASQLPAVEAVAQAEPGPVRSTAVAESPTTEPAEAESSPVPVAAKTGAGVGDRVPEFELKLVDGSIVSSEELTGRERPVFLFFHASW